MLQIGTGELIVILIVALLIFGPAKLPEMGKMVGQTLGYVKKQIKDIEMGADISEPPPKREIVPAAAKIQKPIAAEQGAASPVSAGEAKPASTTEPNAAFEKFDI